jgi:hypothetical protein
MFRSVDDHLQKDLFVNVLETTITISYTYCGVFTPCKNRNLETRSRDYATVDEAVFSPCRAKFCSVVQSRASPHHASHPNPSLVAKLHCKRLDDARVGRGHVTSACSAVTQQ